jgi:hypothetical protein
VKRRHHSRAVGSGILADHENRVRRIEVFEQHGALSDPDAHRQPDACRLMAHVRAIGEIVGAEAADEDLI